MSAFGDAIMGSMIASMDPNKAMEKEALQGYLKNQTLQLTTQKANTVKDINVLLAEAIKDDADPVVIKVYKELLESLV